LKCRGASPSMPHRLLRIDHEARTGPEQKGWREKTSVICNSSKGKRKVRLMRKTQCGQYQGSGALSVCPTLVHGSGSLLPIGCCGEPIVLLSMTAKGNNLLPKVKRRSQHGLTWYSSPRLCSATKEKRKKCRECKRLRLRIHTHTHLPRGPHTHGHHCTFLNPT
jgi:hypothetical protein